MQAGFLAEVNREANADYHMAIYWGQKGEMLGNEREGR
jgi:hypothetical protein